jgi:hypothetical protein
MRPLVRTTGVEVQIRDCTGAYVNKYFVTFALNISVTLGKLSERN